MTSGVKEVYTGWWVNWDHGPLMGSRLTLQTQNGKFLIAFLAIFITWIGLHLWGIIRFIIHSLLSSEDPKDCLHHQRQALLRQNDSAAGSTWSFTQTLWAWRKAHKSNSAFKRLLPYLIGAIIHVAAFTVAGVFSSRVGELGREVLLKPGDHCGFQSFASPAEQSSATNETAEKGLAYWLYSGTIARSSMVYAQECYGNKPSVDFSAGRECQDYTKRTIGNYSTNLDANCPFDKSLCSPGYTMSVDSGYISSREDLGINTKNQDRVWFRKLSTWNPISPDQYGAHLWEDVNGTYYDFGNQSSAEYTYNYTFYALHNRRGRIGYEISSYAAGDGYQPIPELQSPEGDMTLFVLENYMLYKEPVRDILFNSSISYSDSIFYGVYSDVYYASFYATFLGIVEQYEICTSVSPLTCTGLKGIGQIEDIRQAGFAMSDAQYAVARRILDAAESSDFNTIALSLGAEVLDAQSRREGGNSPISASLPEDQWRIEATKFHNVSMAILQSTVTEFPSPRSVQLSQGANEATDQYVLSPKDYFNYTATYSNDTSGAQNIDFDWLCSTQRVRSFNHYSFSNLGIGLIFSIGGLVILTNLCLPVIVNHLRAKHGNSLARYRRLDWIEGETLQLQRKAFEARGYGPWEGVEAEVPIVRDGHMRWRAVEDGVGESGAGLIARKNLSEDSGAVI